MWPVWLNVVDLKIEDKLRCPSVDVDAFATSTACCDLDL